MSNSKSKEFDDARKFIEEGKAEELRELLTQSKNLVSHRIEEGDNSLNLLHIAIGFPAEPGKSPPNAVESVKVLLECDADIEAVDKLPKGMTPLQIAAGYNLVDIATVLLEKGADPDSCETQEFGMDALSLSLFEGYTKMSQLLVEKGASVNLDVAAGIGDLDKLGKFFDEDGNYIDSENDDIKIDLVSAYLTACKNGQVGSVDFLLGKGADINLHPPGSDWGGIGASGLHWAVEHGHFELVKYLVEHGADLEIKDDIWNRTPLQWAQAGENKQITEFLEGLPQKA